MTNDTIIPPMGYPGKDLWYVVDVFTNERQHATPLTTSAAYLLSDQLSAAYEKLHATAGAQYAPVRFYCDEVRS